MTTINHTFFLFNNPELAVKINLTANLAKLLTLSSGLKSRKQILALLLENMEDEYLNLFGGSLEALKKVYEDDLAEAVEFICAGHCYQKIINNDLSQSKASKINSLMTRCNLTSQSINFDIIAHY